MASKLEQGVKSPWQRGSSLPKMQNCMTVSTSDKTHLELGEELGLEPEFSYSSLHEQAADLRAGVIYEFRQLCM